MPDQGVPMFANVVFGDIQCFRNEELSMPSIFTSVLGGPIVLKVLPDIKQT